MNIYINKSNKINKLLMQILILKLQNYLIKYNLKEFANLP
jgi:hypothetical protein